LSTAYPLRRSRCVNAPRSSGSSSTTRMVSIRRLLARDGQSGSFASAHAVLTSVGRTSDTRQLCAPSGGMHLAHMRSMRHAGHFLQVNRVAVASSWLDKVRADMPRGVTPTKVQTVDSMLVFLDQMGRDLGTEHIRGAVNDVAREHGRQRQRLGIGL